MAILFPLGHLHIRLRSAFWLTRTCIRHATLVVLNFLGVLLFTLTFSLAFFFFLLPGPWLSALSRAGPACGAGLVQVDPLRIFCSIVDKVTSASSITTIMCDVTMESLSYPSPNMVFESIPTKLVKEVKIRLHLDVVKVMYNKSCSRT